MPKKPKALPKRSRYQIWKERRQLREERKQFEASVGAVIQWQWALGKMVPRIYVEPLTLSRVWGNGAEESTLPSSGYSGIVYQSNFGAHGVYVSTRVPAGTFALDRIP